MIPDADSIKLLDTLVGEAAYGSALHLSQFGFFIACRFLTLRKQIFYGNMCLQPLFFNKFEAENKQQT